VYGNTGLLISSEIVVVCVVGTILWM